MDFRKHGVWKTAKKCWSNLYRLRYTKYPEERLRIFWVQRLGWIRVGFGQLSQSAFLFEKLWFSLLSSIVPPMADLKAESEANSKAKSTTSMLTKHLQDLEQNSSYNEHESRYSENTQLDKSGLRTPPNKDTKHTFPRRQRFPNSSLVTPKPSPIFP